MLVLKSAIKNPRIAKKLVACFNDSKRENVKALEANIKSLLEDMEGIGTLRHKPKVTCRENDENVAEHFDNKGMPSFTFIDPFGYKGLTLALIEKAIEGWGCDCVFFFNYNRINAAVSNSLVEKHMQALFGAERLKTLAKELKLSPSLREAKILEALRQSIASIDGKYFQSMTFKNSEGTRTSHKMVFVSKHFRGYDIMKSIMAKESSSLEEGVPSFIYSEVDESMMRFALNQPISGLKKMLVEEYAGRVFANIEKLYEGHSVGKDYIMQNYKDAINQLEEEGYVTRPRGRGDRGRAIKFHEGGEYHGDNLFD